MADARVTAMRERHGRERSNLLADFSELHPDVDVDLGLDNWTPAQEQAWREFTAGIDERQRAESRSLATELGYY